MPAGWSSGVLQSVPLPNSAARWFRCELTGLSEARGCTRTCVSHRIAVAVGMSRSSKSVKGVEDIEKAGWDVGKVLGEGAFGKVVFVTRKSDGVSAACKIITKPKEVKKMKLVEMEYKARNAPVWRARTACAACARAPSHPPLGASLSCRL